MNFQLTQDTFIPFIISNAGAIVIFWFSVGNKGLAKSLLSVLFIGAAIFNAYTSLANPASYRDFVDTAVLEWYKNFLSGFFSDHTTAIVLAVSVAQFYIGVAMQMNRIRFVMACLGGFLFGVAIAPLGVGSAFPASIVLSAAFLVLLVAPSDKNDHSRNGDETAILNLKER